VGEVHVPPGTTNQSGLLRPVSVLLRGSYVYQTAKTWLLECWAKLMPQPDSDGFHHMSV
jgi:hypothetical protein